MLLAQTPTDVNISLEGQALKYCTNFKYLRAVFNDQNDIKSEITNRSHKFSNTSYRLYLLLKDRNIPLKVKTQIYITILTPVLTYGHEFWMITSKTRSQLQAAEMKVLRLIRGVTKLDKIRNEDIRRELEVNGILDFVERGQLRLFGHVKRIQEEATSKEILRM